MPNQSDPTQPLNPAPPVIPDFQATDIPPLPPSEVASEALHGAPLDARAIQPGQLANNDSGSAAPPDAPPIITSTPKKKFGGGKIIATILGFLILIGGVAGGVVLTRQNQNIKEKAASDAGFRHEKLCYQNKGQPNEQKKWCWVSSDAECGTDPGHPVECPLPAPWTDCENVTEPCGGQGGGGGGGGNSFSCKDIKSYSATWTLLSSADLAKLKSGDVINFCAKGEVINDLVPVEAARFTINGNTRPETTAKRPGGGKNEFCDSYTLEGATTFNISAEVKVLGKWK